MNSSHLRLPKPLPALAGAGLLIAQAVSPTPAFSQTSLMLGVGSTLPTGTYAEQTELGRHAKLALRVGVPAFPLSGRFEGVYHDIPGSAGTQNDETMVAGKISAVFGVGLPVGPGLYFLGGLGRYRSTKEASDATVGHNGVHGGIGARIRLLGLGIFVEGQVVNRSGVGDDDARHMTVSAGLEF